MNLNILTFYRLNSDSYLFDSFFNFGNFILKNNFIFFNLEIILILYIIYNIIFFTSNKISYKFFYYKYIYFIFILTLICLVNLNYCTKTIIYCHLLITNEFVLINKFFILVAFLFILLIIKNKILRNPKFVNLDELLIIFSFLILFILILFDTYDFFLIYTTIEGISLILYCLSSIMNESLINLEAVIKYFFVNNLASTILLWSVSYIYIFAGTTDGFEIKYILFFFTESIIANSMHYIFIIFIIGLLIKIAIFPFQWWIADVFEGFWTPITLIYAVLIKYTYFVLVIKLITNIFSSIIFLIAPFIEIAALGSVIIGSLAALTQTKIKRFLAYTSISQSGYILIGLSCNTLNGFVSSFIYLIMYCLITLAFFCVLLNIEHIQKNCNLIYFNQLHSLFIFNKEISAHIVIIIFVMAAIPPFTSFFAKFFIFSVCVEAKLEIIVCFLLGMSLISTFYYLNLIQQLIFYKLNEYKIYFYNENIILNSFLRFNSCFFFISTLFIINIYSFIFEKFVFCIYPLSL